MVKKTKFIGRILILLLLLGIPGTSITAASGLKLNYDQKTVVYNGKQVKYQLDGKNISLKKTPGIIINGYALVSYKEVFGTAIGASCKYDSKKNTITISKFGNTVKMTIGSKIGYINGKKTTLPIAPKKMKYIAANTTKIVVPSRFVAEALGYQYTWNSSKSLVTLESPYQIYYDKAWHLYTGALGKVTVDDKSINVAKTPGVILNKTTLVNAKGVFAVKPISAKYKYDAESKKVTITKDDTTILFILGKKTASVNGKSYTLTTYPRIIKNNQSKTNSVMVPAEFTATMLGYDYEWDESSKTSVIKTKQDSPELDGDDEIPEDETVIEKWDAENTDIKEGYTNLLSAVRYSKKGSNEEVTLSGSILLNAVPSVDPFNKSLIYIDLPGVQNTIGNIDYIPSNTDFIKHISLLDMENFTTRIQLELGDNCQYYTSASGNEFSIIVSKTIADEYAVKIPVPKQITEDALTDQDEYLDHQFVITVQGDQCSYLDVNPPKIQSDMITSVEYALNQDGNTDITIATQALQGYQYSIEDGFINIVVDDPDKIYKNIVVLDPGHGGSAPGAGKTELKEKEINLAILYEYAKQYFNGTDSNVKAYWTRIDDSDVALQERADFVKEVKADIFISLHMNSYTTSVPNGMETYYNKSNNDPGFSGLTSKALATHFQNGLISSLGLKSRGVKTANYVVIKNNTVPAILIELGFITNAADFSQLQDPAFQDKAARTIYDLTEEIFDIYPTGR